MRPFRLQVAAYGGFATALQSRFCSERVAGDVGDDVGCDRDGDIDRAAGRHERARRRAGAGRLRAGGLTDSEAVRTALREAAARRRARSAIREEVRLVAADEADREEMRLIREEISLLTAATRTSLSNRRPWSIRNASAARLDANELHPVDDALTLIFGL